MKLHKKKRLAANIMGVGKNKVKMDTEQLDEIAGALTRRDIAHLVKQKTITIKKHSQQSKSRMRANLVKKRKGRKQNIGSRKGSQKTRNPPKKAWMTKIRLQRRYLVGLKTKEMLTVQNYRILRAKAKGGFFRSLRHLKLYSTERGMVKEKKDGN
jgi:large subunit ribosomal protein L19e